MPNPPSTPEIAAKAKLRHIQAIALEAGLRADEIEVFGQYKAKVSLQVLDRFASRPMGKLICVTGMTPTKEGDGKTTTSIGLAQALSLLKKKAILCLREPSLGPVFGSKGGGTGGGRSQVLPMEDINLHFTGDSHAVTSAHNLLAAAVDNHIHHGNNLRLDPEGVFWRRALDMNDRQLREIVAGTAKACEFAQNKTGFDITASSEVMAALSLSTSVRSLKSRLSRISVALNHDGQFVTAKDLKASGAMAVLLRDAIKPNLVQTLEGSPVFIHTGPFANVSHGNSSALATLMALKLANYVVTESGFAADLGLEKFFDIVCRENGFKPAVVVVVVTVKALRAHGTTHGESKKFSERLKGGFDNLERHINNVRSFGVEPVVAINRFLQDSDEEIKAVTDYLRTENIPYAVSDAHRLGGEGAVELAQTVLKTITQNPSDFHYLYDMALPIEKKIEKIAVEIYGAGGAVYSDKAKEDLAVIHRHQLDGLPVNISKTPYSLSDDPQLKGAPSGWKLNVSFLRPLTGAGFIVAVCGKLMLMPGLTNKPALEEMDLGDDGSVQGLF